MPSLNKRRLLFDRFATLFLWACMLALVLLIGAVLAFLIREGAGAISLDFLTEPPREGMTEGGILTPLVGSIQLVVVSMLFAVPIGILTAVFLNEYALDNFFTRSLRVAIRSLAGVPSVVYGLFGLSFFCVFLHFGASLLSAGLTLGCLALPVIVGASEAALQAVPQDYRDASFAMGATRWQTIRRVTLPAAFPTILTGIILSIGRVAGETAPIIFTGAAFYSPTIAKSLFDQVMALPYHILVLATAGTQIEKTRPIQYGTVLVLLALVLGLSSVGILWRTRLRLKYRR